MLPLPFEEGTQEQDSREDMLLLRTAELPKCKFFCPLVIISGCAVIRDT